LAWSTLDTSFSAEDGEAIIPLEVSSVRLDSQDEKIYTFPASRGYLAAPFFCSFCLRAPRILASLAAQSDWTSSSITAFEAEDECKLEKYSSCYFRSSPSEMDDDCGVVVDKNHELPGRWLKDLAGPCYLQWIRPLFSGRITSHRYRYRTLVKSLLFLQHNRAAVNAKKGVIAEHYHCLSMLHTAATLRGPRIPLGLLNISSFIH
jgi:hypothetical protein